MQRMDGLSRERAEIRLEDAGTSQLASLQQIALQIEESESFVFSSRLNPPPTISAQIQCNCDLIDKDPTFLTTVHRHRRSMSAIISTFPHESACNVCVS